MQQPKTSLSQNRSEGLSWIITSEKLWYFLLITLSIISGSLLLLVPRPEVVLGVACLVLICLLLFFHPFLGVLAYIILSYTRLIEDYIPPLANLHFTRILTLVLILIWIIRTASTTKKVFLWEKGFNLVYVMIFAMGVSIPFSFWPTRSFEVLIEFLKIFLFVFIMVHLVDDTKKFKTLIWVYLLVHIFLSLSPIRTLLSLGAQAVQMRLGTATRGFLGDANDFALALNLVLPLVYYLFMAEKNKLVRLLLFLFIVVLFLGILSTSSRGGFVTLVVMVLFLILKSQKKLAGLILFSLLLTLMLILTPEEFWERQATILSYQEEPSAVGRTTAWKAGLNMLLDRPLHGVGLGCFSTAYGARYHLPTVREWISAHSGYIEVGAELGLIGLICYLGLMGLIYQENKRIQKSLKAVHLENDFHFTISQALKLSLIAYAVGSLFLSTAYYPHLYMLLGLTLINRLGLKRKLEQKVLSPA